VVLEPYRIPTLSAIVEGREEGGRYVLRRKDPARIIWTRERPMAAACSGLSDRGSTVVNGTGTLRGCAVPPLTGRMRRSFAPGVLGLGRASSC